MRRIIGIVQPFAKENDYDGLYLTENEIDEFCQNPPQILIYNEHDQNQKGKYDPKTSVGKGVGIRKDPVTKGMLMDIDIDPSTIYGAEILHEINSGKKCSLSLGMQYLGVKSPVPKILRKLISEVSIVTDPAISGSVITHVDPEPPEVTERKKKIEEWIENSKSKKDAYKPDKERTTDKPVPRVNTFSVPFMTTPAAPSTPLTAPSTTPAATVPESGQKRAAPDSPLSPPPETPKMLKVELQITDPTEAQFLQSMQTDPNMLKNLMSQHSALLETKAKERAEKIAKNLSLLGSFKEFAANNPNSDDKTLHLISALEDSVKNDPEGSSDVMHLVSVAHNGRMNDVKEREAYYQQLKKQEIEIEGFRKENLKLKQMTLDQEQKKNFVLSFSQPQTPVPQTTFPTRWSIPQSQAAPQSPQSAPQETPKPSFSKPFAPRGAEQFAPQFRRNTDWNSTPPELQQAFQSFNTEGSKGHDRVYQPKGYVPNMNEDQE
jgi:hypothetical protein